jgi:hypothetical protein
VLRAPRSALPPALSHDLVGQLMRLGLRREAIELMENTLRAHPGAALARFDGLMASSLQGRFDEAYALARSLAPEPALCQPARNWLMGWLGQESVPRAERPRLERVILELRCAATRP